MPIHRIPLSSEAPEIVIQRIAGDLSLRGSTQGELVVRSGDDAPVQSQNGSAIVLQLRDDAHVQVPANSRVRIEHADGDMLVTAMSGAVILGHVEGDVAVRSVGSLQAELIDGDCIISGVVGDVTLGRVDGDAAITGVGGALAINHVADDLNIGNVRGSIRAEAGDDIALRLVLRPECTYALRAGGDLTARIQSDANVTLQVEAGGELNLRRLMLSEPVQGNAARIVLGTGDASASFAAGDDLTLIGLTVEELGDMATDMGLDIGLRVAETVQQFATQFEAQIGAMAKQIDVKLSEMGTGEEIATRIQEKILAAARAAETKISEAMRKMEERQRGAGGDNWADTGRGAGPMYTRKGWGPPVPPTPPVPPAPLPAAVSENERMMLLRMVSEGSISVEQAEKLLAALSGRSGPAER